MNWSHWQNSAVGARTTLYDKDCERNRQPAELQVVLFYTQVKLPVPAVEQVRGEQVRDEAKPRVPGGETA